MDKSLGKTVMRAAGLPVLRDLVVARARWQAELPSLLQEIEDNFGYPVFVKPVNLG
ncbi:MAG: D-alanine--D-alanine ligase A, partial [Candidatus Dormibacteraceae bacterium]